jgi:hypothetical protein
MAVGQILDRTYRLMRAYWQTFFAIAMVPSVALGALAAAAIVFWFRIIWPPIFSHPPRMPHIPVLSLALMSGIGFLVVPVFVLYVPAALYAATQANLGVKVSFGEAYSVAWRHYGRYLWLMVLLLAYLYLPLLVMGGFIGGGAWWILHGSQPDAIPVKLYLLVPAAVLGYCGFLVYSVLIMLRFAVAFPACVVEEIPARAALRRSTTLTCGARGRIFLVLLVVYMVTYAANIVLMDLVGFAASIVAMPALAAHGAGAGAWMAFGASAWFPMIVVYAVFSYAAIIAALAVIYHDQRWRKNGVASSAIPA